ncbi:MAG TPA: hypothetical protein VFX59_24980 [Polyangiales bacterium]|nr:hypothetical protein [Polyangiales bacterium]
MPIRTSWLAAPTITLDPVSVLREVDAARAQGVEPRPALLGPVRFMKHSHGALNRVLNIYAGLLTLLREEGVHGVQLHEPGLVHELDEAEREAYRDGFARLSTLTSRPRVCLTTYGGPLRDNLALAARSGFEALHVDLVSAPEQLDDVLEALPPRMALSLGLLDERDARVEDALPMLRRATMRLGHERIAVAPARPLTLDATTHARLRRLAELAD